jgi:uncharacterized membrane protein YbhN (UPF0104 family)
VIKNFLNTNRNHVKLLRWIGTISALVLLVYLFQRQGWDEIRDAFRQITLWRFILCLFLVFISRLAVVSRWYFLLSSVEEVTWWHTLRITFAGLFASNFLPTTVGGDVVRLAGAIQADIDGFISAASLVVDRLIGMFGMVLALPFGAKPLLGWLSVTRISQTDVAVGLSLPWVSKLKDKIVAFWGRIYRSVMVWSAHPKSLLISLGFSGIHMICLFGIITLFLRDVGEDLSFGLVAGLWSFVYFITLLPISINGYGVQEISMAFIFSEVGGISIQNGLTISLLLRTLMLVGSLPGAIFLPGIVAGTKDSGGKNTHAPTVINQA